MKKKNKAFVKFGDVEKSASLPSDNEFSNHTFNKTIAVIPFYVSLVSRGIFVVCVYMLNNKEFDGKKTANA